MLDKKIFVTVFIAVLLALFTYEKFYKIRYKQAAYISTGLVEATAVKNQIMEYYMTSGKFPSSNEELGLPPPEQFRNESLVSLEVSKDGAITLTFDSRSGVKNGKIQLKPKVRDSLSTQWKCSTSSYPKIRTFYSQCEFIERDS